MKKIALFFVLFCSYTAWAAGHAADVLFEAIRAGDVRVVEALCKKGMDVNVPVTKDGWTPLMAASQMGRLDILKILIGAGAKIEAKTIDGTTALISAVMGNQRAAVRYLLGCGASVEARSYGSRPLIWAIKNKNASIAHDLICYHADINGLDNAGMTPLMWASKMGELDVAEELFLKGAKIDGCSRIDYTALMYAAEMGSCEVVRWLIGKGASVNMTAKCKDLIDETKSPLFLAIGSGSLETVKVLLDAGAKVTQASIGRAKFMKRDDVLGVLSETK